MSHRLSRIITRTGDGGLTGLADGSRVPKDSPRIVALGEVDELNSVIGLLLCEVLPPLIARDLSIVQHELFDLGGELAIPGHLALHETTIARLETAAETLNQALPPLRDFILPGGCRPAALAHLARTVCRRAERSVVPLTRDRVLSPTVPVYLNRLSDFLFIMARSLNQAAGRPDVLWQPTATTVATTVATTTDTTEPVTEAL
jgi:cob(I)alamin adenosyltransferase